MACRFSRHIKIAPVVPLNLSKSGISTSIGRRGAWFTVGSKRTPSTIGLPGSGLSYTETRRGTGSGGSLVIVIILFAFAVFVPF